MAPAVGVVVESVRHFTRCAADAGQPAWRPRPLASVTRSRTNDLWSEQVARSAPSGLQNAHLDRLEPHLSKRTHGLDTCTQTL